MKSISQLEDTSIFTLFRNLTVSNFRESLFPGTFSVRNY